MTKNGYWKCQQYFIKLRQMTYGLVVKGKTPLENRKTHNTTWNYARQDCRQFFPTALISTWPFMILAEWKTLAINQKTPITLQTAIAFMRGSNRKLKAIKKFDTHQRTLVKFVSPTTTTTTTTMSHNYKTATAAVVWCPLFISKEPKILKFT